MEQILSGHSPLHLIPVYTTQSIIEILIKRFLCIRAVFVNIFAYYGVELIYGIEGKNTYGLYQAIVIVIKLGA
jgi:hypothetical protein